MTHHYLCYYCIQNVDAAAATGESSSSAAAAAATHIVVSDETIDSISSQLSKALDPATLEPHRINVEIEVGSSELMVYGSVHSGVLYHHLIICMYVCDRVGLYHSAGSLTRYSQLTHSTDKGMLCGVICYIT